MVVNYTYIKEPKVGSIWKHKDYAETFRILDYGLLWDSAKPAIIYMSKESGDKWIRPLDEFMANNYVEVSE